MSSMFVHRDRLAALESQLATKNPLAELTPRESEILSRVAAGGSNRTIADELGISPATVKRHVSNILGETGHTNRTQLARYTNENEAASQRDPAGQFPD